MKLFASASPHPPEAREQLIDALNALQLDGLALANAVYLAHRNLRGPLFGALHKLFGKAAAALDGYTDQLPEFVAMLGGVAVGTAEQVATGSRIKPYPADTTDGLAHCREIVARLTTWHAYLNDAIALTNDLGAADAMDLVTEILRGSQQWAWMIGAHLDESEEARSSQEGDEQQPPSATGGQPLAGRRP